MKVTAQKTQPSVKGTKQPETKSSKNPLDAIPTYVRIQVGTDREKVSLSTNIRELWVNLELPLAPPRDVTATVAVSAIHPADNHPRVDVSKLELYTTDGKKVATVNKPEPLPRNGPARDPARLFRISFSSKDPANEPKRSYVVVVTTGVGDNKKAYQVRSEPLQVSGAY